MRASRWLTYGSYIRSPAGAAAVSGPSGASCGPVTAGLAATERMSMFACIVYSSICLLLYILVVLILLMYFTIESDVSLDSIKV